MLTSTKRICMKWIANDDSNLLFLSSFVSLLLKNKSKVYICRATSQVDTHTTYARTTHACDYASWFSVLSPLSLSLLFFFPLYIWIFQACFCASSSWYRTLPHAYLCVFFIPFLCSSFSNFLDIICISITNSKGTQWEVEG